MSINEVFDRDPDSLDVQIEYVMESANKWQEIYEETLEGEPTEKDLEMVVDSYAIVLDKINHTHNLMAEEGYDQMASKLLETFEETLVTQSRYKKEVKERLGYTPADLFIEEHIFE